MIMLKNYITSIHFTLKKIENTEIPTYIVEAKDSYILAVLVSYKDSKVTVSKKVY